MPLNLCMLGSGSAGNAAWISAPGVRMLLDCGFSDSDLRRRMTQVGGDPDDIDTIVVSHLHSDHLHPHAIDRRLNRAGKRRLVIHPDHEPALRKTRSFQRLRERGGVVHYAAGVPLELAPGLTLTPLPVSHDAEPTFGFRLDWTGDGPRVSAAIISDVGVESAALTPLLADVDLLGLEFNHDPRMLHESGRPRMLIDRIASDRGHLSNEQAAAWLGRIMAVSPRGGPSTVLLLHLSSECNTPALARAAADAVPVRHGRRPIIAAVRQDRPDRLRVVGPMPVQGTLFETG